MLGLVATRGDPELRWMPLAGVVMFSFGYAFFRLANRFVRRLAERLALTLRKELDGPVQPLNTD